MARSPIVSSLARAFALLRGARQAGLPVADYVDRERLRALSRRRFLGAAVGGAALAIGTPAFLRGAADDDIRGESANPARRLPRVAVIGGGMAGLHCAYRLKRKGYYATVYEGANRLGGRMFSDRTTFSGQHCELGGEYIDTGHVTMRKLAKELDIDLYDTSKDTFNRAGQSLSHDFGYFSGQQRNAAQILSAYAPIAAAIDARLSLLTVPDDGISFGNPNGGGADLDNQSLKAFLAGVQAEAWIKKLIEVAYVIEYGLEPEVANSYSLLGLISTELIKFDVFGASDERFYTKGGNSTYIESLAGRIDDRIETGQVFEAARINADGSYALTFQDSGATRTVKADHVVFALPFSILRSCNLTGLGLPVLKQVAINELSYGQNAKLMVGVQREPVWRKLYASDGESFSDLPYQNSWESSRLQPGGRSILTQYTGGNRAVATGDGTLDFQAGQFVDQINKTYPGVKAQYTGERVRQVWKKSPWVKASYAAYSVGQYLKFAGTEGDRVGNLHFAGEHTDFDNQGYMEGACRSGKRAAQEIVDDLLGMPQAIGMRAHPGGRRALFAQAARALMPA